MTLRQQMADRIQMQKKSRKTYKTYWHWCERFIRFHKRGDEWVHPKDLNERDVEAWLTHLAVRECLAANSQNVALQAVCYLYREILNRPLVDVSAIRAKRPDNLREVLSVDEVGRLFAELDDHFTASLVARLMYGSGLRVGDAVAIRVKDLHFDRFQIALRRSKGAKDRYVSFPECLHPMVRQALDETRQWHQHDLEHKLNGVSLPDAYRRKSPRAANDLAWYWLFPSHRLSSDGLNVMCRHHRQPDPIAKHIKDAAKRAGITKRVTSHVLRHSYATHAHEQGVPVRTLMELLGHNSIETTQIYLHADQHGATASPSPLTRIMAPSKSSRSTHLRVA